MASLPAKLKWKRDVAHSSAAHNQHRHSTTANSPSAAASPLHRSTATTNNPEKQAASKLKAAEEIDAQPKKRPRFIIKLPDCKTTTTSTTTTATITTANAPKKVEETPQPRVKIETKVDKNEVRNLRPLEPLKKPKSEKGKSPHKNTPHSHPPSAKSAEKEGNSGGGGGEKKKQKKKSSIKISLSKREIEEDIYSLTGGRPVSRPKKWPKNIQKKMDAVFPGLGLENRFF